jgi:hypothetical protein
MYLVDHPGAIQPPQMFMAVSITICQQFEKKMEKQKKTVLKARQKQAIDCTNEIFWSFYLLHVFFKFKQLNNAQNKF